MTLDPYREWMTDGTFLDRSGTSVKAYDDVLLHVEAKDISDGTTSVALIPADSVGTVIFVTEDEPVLLQLECDAPGGFVFADNYPASQVSLHQTAEEKRSNAQNR